MDMAGLPDDWADKLTERTKRIGSGINLAELFYTGERNSAADYLASHGWRNVIRSTAEAYAANGFELPDDELATFGGDSGYLTSTRI
jgi:O-methyltransferase involved in polyketide biosynthesis